MTPAPPAAPPAAPAPRAAPAAAHAFASRVAAVVAILLALAGCGPRTAAPVRICTPDARRCVDAGRVERCFGDGTLWLPYQTCGAGLRCVEGACTAPDAEGDGDRDTADSDTDAEPFDRDLGERELPDLDAEYENPCPGRDDMVWTGLWYCIDKYEAVLSPHADCRGDFIDGVDVPIPEGFPRCTGCEAIDACSIDCTPADRAEPSTPLYACSKAGVVPAWGITWYRAWSACDAVQKRLCTAQEWELACSGSGKRKYTYGDIYEYDACNDGIRFEITTSATQMQKGSFTISHTGSYQQCVTPEGIYDLQGNLAEIVGSSYSQEPQYVDAGYVGDTYDNTVFFLPDSPTPDSSYIFGCSAQRTFESLLGSLADPPKLEPRPNISALPDVGFRCCTGIIPVLATLGDAR